MEIYQVFNEEFRMALLKKFRELWENIDTQLIKIRKTMHVTKL